MYCVSLDMCVRACAWIARVLLSSESRCVLVADAAAAAGRQTSLQIYRSIRHARKTVCLFSGAVGIARCADLISNLLEKFTKILLHSALEYRLYIILHQKRSSITHTWRRVRQARFSLFRRRWPDARSLHSFIVCT